MVGSENRGFFLHKSHGVNRDSDRIGNRESWSVSINRVTPIAGWFISWKTRK